MWFDNGYVTNLTHQHDNHYDIAVVSFALSAQLHRRNRQERQFQLSVGDDAVARNLTRGCKYILRPGNNCHYNALVEDATTGHWCLVDSKDARVVPLDTTAALKLLRDAVSGLVVAPVRQRKVRGWIAPVDELFRESVEMAAHAAAAT